MNTCRGFQGDRCRAEEGDRLEGLPPASKRAPPEHLVLTMTDARRRQHATGLRSASLKACLNSPTSESTDEEDNDQHQDAAGQSHLAAGFSLPFIDKLAALWTVRIGIIELTAGPNSSAVGNCFVVCVLRFKQASRATDSAASYR